MWDERTGLWSVDWSTSRFACPSFWNKKSDFFMLNNSKCLPSNPIDGPSIVSVNLKLHNWTVLIIFLFFLFRVCSKVELRLRTTLRVLEGPKEETIYQRGKSKSVPSVDCWLLESTRPRIRSSGCHNHNTSYRSLQGHPLENGSWCSYCFLVLWGVHIDHLTFRGFL